MEICAISAEREKKTTDLEDQRDAGIRIKKTTVRNSRQGSAQ
jgi:hypothetical protein